MSSPSKRVARKVRLHCARYAEHLRQASVHTRNDVKERRYRRYKAVEVAWVAEATCACVMDTATKIVPIM